jgi:hypothetical protein
MGNVQDPVVENYRDQATQASATQGKTQMLSPLCDLCVTLRSLR